MSSLKNLSVPFNVPIPGGMCPGKMVIVSGTIPSMSHRFAVNLLTRSGDIALHVCPRFKENQVVRNNVLNMNWGPEERHGSMPVYPGQSFEIMILCETYDYKIAFNGRHFTEFSHRLPFNSVTNLAVDGEVVVYNVNFKDPSGYGTVNNNTSNTTAYGFQPVRPPTSSGGLYPTVPLPSDSDSGGYANSHGSAYPKIPSSQPSYPNIPHQGPYPQVPSSHSGGHSPSSHSKSGFLDNAGMALAGAIGTGLLAGAMNRKLGSDGKRSFLDDAGKALVGSLIGGSVLAATDKLHRGTQPTSHMDSGFMNSAGNTLAGILSGGGGVLGNRTSQRGILPTSPTSRTHPGFLDQAGSVLADIMTGGGLSGGRSYRDKYPTSPTSRTHPGLFDQAGSVLSDIIGGGLSGGRSHRDMLPSSSSRTQSGFVDRAGSNLADNSGDGGLTGGGRPQRDALPSSPTSRSQAGFLNQTGRGQVDSVGGGGLMGPGHHKHKKLGGVLGVPLGTAIAGAALTGHLNPVKMAKKQRKAQKKALKYGIPLAGVGLGAYALHKGFKGFRRSSSSSSCSSSD